MANHAGFGVAAVLRQEVIEDAVTIFSRAGIIPSRFESPEEAEPGSTAATPLGPWRYDLFLETPRISLSARVPAPRVDVRLNGTLWRIPPELPGEIPGAREEFKVRIEARLRIPPLVRTDGGMVRLGLDFGLLEIEHHAISVREGPPLPASLLDDANSELARLWAQAELRAHLGGTPPGPPILDQVICQLGALRLGITGTRVRMLDGALAIGVQLASTDPSSMLRLEGSVADLSNFCTADTNAAICVHPDLVLLLLDRKRPEIAARAREHAIEIRDLNFRLEDVGPGGPTGSVLVEGSGWRGILGAGFEILVRPSVYTTRVVAELRRYRVFGVWVSLLTLLRNPMIEQTRSTLSSVLSGALRVDRPIVIMLPGTRGPSVNLRTDEVRIGSGGLDAALSIRANFTREVRIAGPAIIGPTDDAMAYYELVGLSSIVHPDDPSPWVEWLIRRLDRTAEVLRETLRIQDAGALTATLDIADRMWGSPGGTRFEVACRVYRHQAGTQADLYRGAMQVNVDDPLDRTRRFVCWSHSVPRPFVTPDPRPGVGNRVEYAVVHRRSKIHRTAVPGRCRFAHRYSQRVLRVPDARLPDSPVLEYLDELPFPRDQLVRYRRMVCDYCFFGGPTRTVPRI